MINALSTLAAAVIFALIFYAQTWWKWPKLDHRRSHRFVSFSAGMAVAYVFIHLLPELASASDEFVEVSAGRQLPFPQYRVYAAALLGFVLFYALAHMVSWSRVTGAQQDNAAALERISFRVLTSSYALYVFIVSYLVAHEMQAGGGQVALYTLAMSLHFLGLAYGMRRENAPLYDLWSKHALAAAAIAGWAVAEVIPLSDGLAYTALGFVGGAVIMNTATSELPGKHEGRLFAFLFGSILYSAVLLLIAH
jgi:hypothetical protein